jgi:succinylglutamic semialdehyde dehydrogenase
MSRSKLFIGGVWQEGGGAAFHSLSPLTEAPVWEGRAATDADVQAACDAARSAQCSWRNTPVADRRAVLARFTDLLRGELGNELASAITDEVGKPLWESRTEVNAVIGKLNASLEAFDTRAAEIRRSTPSSTSITRFSPVGVVGVIGPFNFPIHMPNGHIMPALLAGNTVIFKPSPLAPLCASLYAAGLAAAGLPPGVLNLLQGDAIVGRSLIRGQIDAVCFTGSRSVGLSIHRDLAGRPEVELALEMGGISPLVVTSYRDLRAATYLAVNSAFITAGQRCNCARRLIVTDEVADEFIPKLSSMCQRLVIGDPGGAAAVFSGPLISAAARDRVLAQQADLLSHGATAISPAVAPDTQGYFLRPGLIDVTDRGFLDEEIFGPVLQVERVRDLDEAIDSVNRSESGLAAGLVSTSKEEFQQFSSETSYGLLNWNQQLTGASGLAPFGGLRASGNHRPAGLLSVDYLTDGIAITEVEELVLPESLNPGISF